MRVLLFGDSHCDVVFVRKMIDKAVEFGCDAVVSVGDFGFWPRMKGGPDFLILTEIYADKYKMPLYWIDGNHEDFATLEELYHGLSETEDFVKISNHITYIPRGFTWVWDDVTFMGMGGAYSIDRRLRTLGYDWFVEEEITTEQCVRAMDRGPVDVLISHDCPQRVNLKEYVPWYRQEPASYMNRRLLDNIVDQNKPKLVVHGHYHAPYREKIGDTQFIGLAHNYWEQGLSDTFWIIDTEDYK